MEPTTESTGESGNSVFAGIGTIESAAEEVITQARADAEAAVSRARRESDERRRSARVVAEREAEPRARETIGAAQSEIEDKRRGARAAILAQRDRLRQLQPEIVDQIVSMVLP